VQLISEVNDNFQEKSIIFALSQSAYGACLFIGYWGYLVLFRKFRYSYIFPFRYSYLFLAEKSLHGCYLLPLSFSCIYRIWFARNGWNSIIFMNFILFDVCLFILSVCAMQFISINFLQRRKSYCIWPEAVQDVYAVYFSILSKVDPSGRREDSACVVWYTL
jgi:hypothetical protein